MKKFQPETAYRILVGGRSVCLAMIFTASMVYQINRVGLSPLQLVLVGTTLELSVFLFEVPTGIVADVYSRRLSILIGTFLIGLGFIVEGSLPFFSGVLLAQVLWGLGFTFTSGATQAWIVDEVGEANAGPVFLRGSQVDNVCSLIGIGLSAALGSVVINLPILVGGGLLMVLAVFLAFTMPERGFTPKVDTGASGSLAAGFRAMSQTLKDGIQLVRVHPALLTIFGIGLFYGLYSEGYDRLSTAHLLKDMALPALGGWQPIVWMSLIEVLVAIAAFGVTELARRRIDMRDVARVTRALFGFSALLVGALLGFALAGDFLVAAGLMVLIGVMRSLIGPFYGTWINQRLDSGVRATVISMSSQVDAIGQIAGGPGVGAIGNTFSIRAALLTSGLILSPVLWLFARAGRTLQREAVQAAEGRAAISPSA